MTAAADAQSAEKKYTEQNIKNTQVFNLKEGQTNGWFVGCSQRQECIWLDI